ncbi:methyltransferase domain-containing protein [Candidatus Gottesmanbacteria bacterium]|nr:methyltransferase domain-containing protein [Candidatus Gottesmanbacteria bacterium]
MALVHYLHRSYVQYQADILQQFIKENERVLDFGCGDLTLAVLLLAKNPKLHITGVDVVDFHHRPKGISFQHYDGVRLPYKDKMFDTIISYHVFHHCDDPRIMFGECLRVSKKRIIFVESVIRSRFDNIGIRVTDWVFNRWKDEAISMPYHFLSLREWYRLFAIHGLTLEEEKMVGVLPSWLPIGGTYLFSLHR